MVFSKINAVIANQCAHWCGNPPVERNQVTITTKNCGNALSSGCFSVHFPSNRGIATTSVRTGLAMTAFFQTPIYRLTVLLDFIHKLVEFCFQIRYWMFKTGRYFIYRKVAEAVSRFLSTQVDPLFYLSSFQSLLQKTPAAKSSGGFLGRGR